MMIEETSAILASVFKIPLGTSVKYHGCQITVTIATQKVYFALSVPNAESETIVRQRSTPMGQKRKVNI